jgi:ribonuclease VapC
MIVFDTSAIVAILKAEPEAGALIDSAEAASKRLISSGTLLECGIVIGSRYGTLGLDLLQQLYSDLDVAIVPFDSDQCMAAVEAHMRFGRGSGHPAKLNFGDCFSYALARTRNLPLLFKGDDFIHTDIEPALKPA